jgi:glycosyltransferase involved in cell wall biosynthesis
LPLGNVHGPDLLVANLDPQPLSPIELTILMPCLNEVETVGICVQKAVAWLARAGVEGEVLVADNGSTDGSQALATATGARVVPVAARGYGAALLGGIAAARGRYVIMGDADDSYDFSQLDPFLAKLRGGADLVQGCRLPAGGGEVLPGAMPWLHRWWGNPMFSWMARVMFRAPIHDIYCGLRGFRCEWQKSLDQRCLGMEFATEMLIKASLRGAKIAEVPIKLHPDGRKTRTPHLRTFRDGWRTLRFFLLCSPRWLFFAPGAFLMLLGLALFVWLVPGTRQVYGVYFDVHTLLAGAGFLIIGFQALVFGTLTKVFAVTEGILPPPIQGMGWERKLTLERGVITGLGILALGVTGAIVALGWWREVDFGDLPVSQTMRLFIPSITAAIVGCQTVLGSFFLSVLQLRRR